VVWWLLKGQSLCIFDHGMAREGVVCRKHLNEVERVCFGYLWGGGWKWNGVELNMRRSQLART